jgi:cob(I)alamin adenosyltransferase
MRLRAQRLAEQVAEGMSSLVPTLTPEQLRHLARQFNKHNQAWREEWLEGTPAQLAQRRLQKAEERAETFYGRINEAQRKLLEQRIAQSAFNPGVAWAERLRRQQDMLQILSEHATGSDMTHVKAEMMALLQRSLDSPDAAYRATLERILQEGCHTLAELHNSTTAAQRRHLQEKLRGYEADARMLMAEK